MSRKSLYEIIKNANDKDKLADRFLNDFIYTIETLDEHEQKKPSKAFHPSNLNCDRSSVLEVMGADIDGNKKTHNLISICRNGTSTHLMVQEYVSKMASLGLNWVFEDVAKYVAENNIPLKIASNMNIDSGVYETKIVSEEYNIRGLCDGLLSYKDKDGNKKYVLLEIKTINSRQYYKMNDILPKHRVQAVSYCSLLQVDAVIFLYVERDLLNKRTFYYKPTKQEKSAWKKRMTFLNDCVKNNIIPEKPAGINCQYCAYKKLCKKLGEGKLRYEPSKKL